MEAWWRKELVQDRQWHDSEVRCDLIIVGGSAAWQCDVVVGRCVAFVVGQVGREMPERVWSGAGVLRYLGESKKDERAVR